VNCLDCATNGKQTPAVGLCHSCSAALCLHHMEVVQYYLETSRPICGTAALPIAGRVILCRTCRKAVEQPRLSRTA
jgi:hypothetical protein